MDSNSFLKIRNLTRALLFSGGLNIIMAAVVIYFFSRELPPQPYCEYKPAQIEEQQTPLALGRTNEEMLRYFKTLPMEQLVLKLSQKDLVDNGYTLRDLALSALVTFHYFDINRALPGDNKPQQERKIPFAKSKKGALIYALVYPSLTEQQFQSINQFVSTENWPQTSEGIFKALKKQKDSQDSGLVDTFLLTPEFLSVETLFNRSGANIDKLSLLQVILEGSWQQLSEFSHHQHIAQDLTPSRRQYFLLNYVDKGSQIAAYMLLKTDGYFVARKLNDTQILSILSLLQNKTPESEEFALTVLTSPRSDAAWQAAAHRLFEYANTPKPEKNITHAALTRFAKGEKNKPSNILVKKQEVKIVKKDKNTTEKKEAKKVHIVQEGDSLWKISRKYKVNIDSLKKTNKLKSDVLKPGLALTIPKS